MPNLIFNLLKEIIFLVFITLITWGLGNICLRLLEINYNLTLYGSFAINLILIYVSNFITLAVKGDK